MFVYSYRVKINVLGLDKLLESIFCIPLAVFFLQKVVKMLEEVVVGWWEVRWIWRMRQNFVAQFIQLLKSWMCDMQSGIIVKNWALSVDWCWLQVLQFSVHLNDLLSIHLRCNGFTRIQKVVVDQMGSRAPNSDQDLFLVQVWLWDPWESDTTEWLNWTGFGKCFGASSWSSHWAGHCRLMYKIHFLSHITIWLRNGLLCRIRERPHFKTMAFLIFGQLMRHSLIEPFHLSNLLQMLNDHRVVDVEFLDNFLCSLRSFSDPLNWSLSISMAGHYAPHLQDSCLLHKTSWAAIALYVH